ncbi:MAG: hypothetical protein KIG36_02825 [Eubacteriales bacterium]|nr:hypothetical protein [Eubacteriales bacterium]
MFGIEGVTEIHSSYNDCLLEWKLFEKVYSKRLLFLKERLYDYSPEYIVPCTYLNTKLAEYANIEVPDVQAKATELLSLRFPQKLLKSIRKFPTNITGMALEHGINAYLGAIEQDNMLFLSRNKSHLKYVGSLDSRFREIKVIPERDGTFEAVNDEDKEYVNQVNDVTSIIMDQIKPIADYLKTNIFTGNKIMTQELVFSDDRRVLALCDLSDSKNVVEIKTKPIFMIQSNDYLRKEIAEQLYYQAKGRNTYVLSIDFYSHKSDRLGCTIYNDLFIRLYKAELTKGEPQ